MSPGNMQVEEGVGESSYKAVPFLTSALSGGGWPLYPRKSSGSHCRGGWEAHCILTI
jgi:hypothetical protein